MNKEETEIKYIGQEDIIKLVMQKDYEIYKLQHRIDKAIEYLESYNTDFKNSKFGEAPISLRELGDLLDILRGNNEET